MNHAVLTVAEMREADRLTIEAGTSGLTLMERAGAATADACCTWLGSREALSGYVVVLCGPGNNGGDGFVAARLLRQRGYRVVVHASCPLDALPGDAAAAARAWAGPIGRLEDAPVEDAAGIVDGLLGAGLTRPLVGPLRAIVERVNAAGRPVIAVDVPSGIDGDSGMVMGTSIEADITVTFFRPKPGHHLMPGAARCGHIIVADIGIPAAVLRTIKPKTMLNVPQLWLGSYPWPTRDGHKYKRGHAVVLSGGGSHTGAARLAARAALRIGAGLVTLASPTAALAVNATHLTAVMLRGSDGPEGLAAILADGRKNVVVIGPGLGVGPETCTLVEAALTAPRDAGTEGRGRACVMDADALTSFAGRADTLAALVVRAAGSTVITPHDGEFARLFAKQPDIAGAPSKLAKVRAAAAFLGCVVLLKGADTVVAEPGGQAAIATADAPWLATAGSGDVLSGLIGGLLAQALPAFEAANAAVFMHAAAAQHFGPGLIAEDLPECIPAVLRALQPAATSNQHRRPASA